MFRVVWGREILDNISKVYDRLDADGRERLMVAIEALDSQLLNDPLEFGESRDSRFSRIAINPPLAITFRIDVPRNLVRVASVNYFHRQR